MQDHLNSERPGQPGPPDPDKLIKHQCCVGPSGYRLTESQRQKMMPDTKPHTLRTQDSAAEAVLYMTMELSKKIWKLASETVTSDLTSDTK